VASLYSTMPPKKFLMENALSQNINFGDVTKNESEPKL
jgi:hypothetical protein